MKPVYQVFAEGPDGSIYMIMARGQKQRWFDDIEDARKAGLAATRLGTSDIWIMESKPIEKVTRPEKKPTPKKADPTPAADVHLFHEFNSTRDVPGEHNMSGDPCHDVVEGMLHRRSDLDGLIEILHAKGFRVTATRVSRVRLLEDPDFLPQERD